MAATSNRGMGTPGAHPSAVFNMMAIESIDAIFDGDLLRPGSFRANGELRLVQLAGHGRGHSFTVGLESASHIRDVLPNRQLARAADANGHDQGTHAFDVRIPSRSPPEASKPLALLRYASAREYAPIPLRVIPRWSFAEGVDRLELRVAAHPKIKGGLSDVRIVVAMSQEVSACKAEPAGAWDAATHTFTWKVEHLPAGAAPLAFKVDFKVEGVPKAGRAGRPLTAHFHCDLCNFTGVQAKPGQHAQVGKILSRFVSGKYVVHPSASSGGRASGP